MNETYKIDFFSLMFLAEAVTGARTIARHSTFEDFSEIHYHKMNNNQRKQFLTHVKNLPNFTLENEDCAHFYARFSPTNKVLVTCFYNGIESEIEAYYYQGEYHTSRSIFIQKEYIIEIK